MRKFKLGQTVWVVVINFVCEHDFTKGIAIKKGIIDRIMEVTGYCFKEGKSVEEYELSYIIKLADLPRDQRREEHMIYGSFEEAKQSFTDFANRVGTTYEQI